jgi:hypothetical protein
MKSTQVKNKIQVNEIKIKNDKLDIQEKLAEWKLSRGKSMNTKFKVTPMSDITRRMQSLTGSFGKDRFDSTNCLESSPSLEVESLKGRIDILEDQFQKALISYVLFKINN